MCSYIEACQRVKRADYFGMECMQYSIMYDEYRLSQPQMPVRFSVPYVPSSYVVGELTIFMICYLKFFFFFFHLLNIPCDDRTMTA